MSKDKLDYAQQITTEILQATQGEEPIESLLETYPDSKLIFEHIANEEEQFFYSMVMTFKDDKPEVIALSHATDKDEFLMDSFTVLSVMDAESIIFCIDAFIKVGAGEVDPDLTLEQLHAMGEDNVYPCISLLEFNPNDGLSGRYLPYDNGKVLEEKIIDVDHNEFKEMDKSFQIAFSGLETFMKQDIADRIHTFWIEFVDNEEASSEFFPEENPDRPGAIKAFKKLEATDRGKQYLQRIIEDALFSASRMHAIKKASSTDELDEEIQNHAENETEIGQWLYQSRLIS